MSQGPKKTDINEVTTPGIASFGEGESSPARLFRVMPDIPIAYALEQASVFMGCVHRMTFVGVMEKDDTLVWAAHVLSGMAHSLVEDVGLAVNYCADGKNPGS